MDLRLYYPVKVRKADGTPLINQGFAANPTYYAKFRDDYGRPLKGHDGIDFNATHGTPVYAAHDGMAYFERDTHGGEGIWIETTGYASVCWHMIGDTDPAYPSPIPLDGKDHAVKAGDLIGYADNTGFPYESSGDHLHFGLVRCREAGQVIDINNGFNGRIDPAPFFTKIYAADVQTVVHLLTQVAHLLGEELDIITAKIHS